jgi:hypothetical protein
MMPVPGIKSLRLALLSGLLLGLLAGPGMTFAQGDSQPLTIVVRDGAGNPLAGITLDILLTGPPHEPFDSCVTDEAGRCTLDVPPGAYLIHFRRGWRGREFVPTEQQNAGALDDGGLGGFGVYFEPGDSPQVVTFVVGQERESGQLVPLWDMSRDPDAPPQPFAYDGDLLGDPEDALAAYDLGPLDPTIVGATPQAALDVTGTAQVVVSEYPGQATPDAAQPEAVSTSTPEGGSIPQSALGPAMLGLLGLSIIIAIFALATFLWKRRRAKG